MTQVPILGGANDVLNSPGSSQRSKDMRTTLVGGEQLLFCLCPQSTKQEVLINITLVAATL